MWWLLLPLSLVINNFFINLVSQSLIQQNNRPVSSQRISIISYMKGYCSYRYFNHPQSFLENLVSQSFTTENRLFSSYINNLYLYSGWISALFRCAAQRCPPVSRRLCPQTEVVFLASCSLLMCQSVTAAMCTQIRCQYPLTIQVKICCPTG